MLYKHYTTNSINEERRDPVVKDADVDVDVGVDVGVDVDTGLVGIDMVHIIE
jgi:hypothetical protein